MARGGVTLSRGLLCQKWKPLDISGTHLHLVTQLLRLINCCNSFFFQHASYEPPDEDEENELDYYSDGEHALYSPLQKLPGGLNR